MDSFQGLIVAAVLGGFMLITIPVLALALAWLTHPQPSVRHHRRRVALILLLVSLFMGGVMFQVLKAAPAFDFVDQCRPIGVGACWNGESYVAVEQRLQVDLWRAVCVYLIIPLVLGAALGCIILRRRG